MYCIQVLLSTFNGEKYIRTQLDSILRQKEVSIHCMIRDDGSIDNTFEILSEYNKQYENIELIKGENIGYGPSFMDLIRRSGDCDYYAFSDQDDVWEPQKLISAIDKLKSHTGNTPIMYFSNCTIVDDNLKEIGMLHNKRDIIPSKKISALLQGFAPGCTMVFNTRSRDLIKMYRPQQIYAHDFWIPLLHIYLGKIIYDHDAHILYRQHENNVFGRNRSLLKLARIKLRFIRHQPNYYSRLAKDLIAGYGDLLDSSDLPQLMEISGYKNTIAKRFKLLVNKDVKRNTLRGTLILKILILSSRF